MHTEDVPPADIPLGAQLLSVIARLNRWTTRNADLSLPSAQARLLAQIDELGAGRIGDLARADHCSQPTMTTQVQRLEEMGLATRTVDPSDARAVLVSLTPAGLARLHAVRRARAEVLAPLISELNDVDRQRLQDVLHTLSGLLNAAAVQPTREEAPKD